jgi:hypothetical protein
MNGKNRDFSLFHGVHNGFGAHTAPNPRLSGTSLPVAIPVAKQLHSY